MTITSHHPANLATAAMQAELSQLGQLADQHNLPGLSDHLTRLNRLCQVVERTVSEGVHRLAIAGDGLSGLLILLDRAEQHTVPAHSLHSLLAPLAQQMQTARDHIGQLL